MIQNEFNNSILNNKISTEQSLEDKATIVSALGDRIGYAGKVKIEKVKGNKVVQEITHHNNGTLVFFNLLVKCILGYSVGSQMPSYCNCFSGINNNLDLITSGYKTAKKYSSVLASLPVASKKLVSSIDSNAGQFKFFIPYTQLTSDSIELVAFYNTPIIGLEDNLLAYVKLDSAAQMINIGRGDNILITWTVEITNRDED